MLTCIYHPSAIETSFPNSFLLFLVLFVKSSLQTSARLVSVIITSENIFLYNGFKKQKKASEKLGCHISACVGNWLFCLSDDFVSVCSFDLCS